MEGSWVNDEMNTECLDLPSTAKARSIEWTNAESLAPVKMNDAIVNRAVTWLKVEYP